MIIIDWILTRKCNFNCYYCLQGSDTRKEPCVPVDVSFMNEARPGSYLFHLTGGEPLLVPNFGEVCAEVAGSGNILSLNTNLSIRPSALMESVRASDVAFVNASVHFPYRRTGFGRFAENYTLLRKGGYFVVATCVMPPETFDECVRFIDDVRNKTGVVIFPKLMRGVSCGKRYPEAYSAEQVSELERLTEAAALDAKSFSAGGFELLCRYSPSIDSWSGVSVSEENSSLCYDGVQAIHLDVNGDWIKCVNCCIGNVYEDGFKPLFKERRCDYSRISGNKKYCNK